MATQVEKQIIVKDGSGNITFDKRWVWKPEAPHEEWSPWRTVETVVSTDVSYSVSSVPDGLFSSRITGLHPYHESRVISERRLVRYWVDENEGPMAEVLDVERRYD